jgi:hypothetical protein
MTLPHTAKLVWVRRTGYIWSRHRYRGRRESKTNPCKHPDCPIPSEKLHRQKAPSLEVWSGGSHIPLSLTNERCMSLRHQRKASSPLNRSVSHHQQVWAGVLSSGATIKAVGSTYCVPRLPTQWMYETSDWCGCRRHHSIGTRLDLQDPSHHDSRSTRPSHTQQDYSILQDIMEWSL